MPELPEVETVCRGLAQSLEGQRITRVIQRRPDLRIPLPDRFVERLEGRRVTVVRRRAKYALVHLDDGAVLIVHLGMSGRVVIGGVGGQPYGAHDHVILETEAGTCVRYNDARRFGLMALSAVTELEQHSLLAGLGPEPLGDVFNPGTLHDSLQGRKTPIKAALLDQKIVAGLGNIYVSEALFRSGISPLRPAASISSQECERLVPAIRQVLEEAIEAGGSTLRDYVQSNGELGYFQHRFAVYDREGQTCPGCTCDVKRTGGVQRIVQSGRSTYYCPQKQQ